MSRVGTYVGRLDILEDVGDKALEYCEAVEEEKLTDGELYRLARSLTQVGEVDVQAGDLTAAMPRLEEALALATALVAKEPENELW